MSTQRQAMQDYLDSLVKRADFTAYYTDDVVASFEGTDERRRARGRRAADPVRARGRVRRADGAQEPARGCR